MAQFVQPPILLHQKVDGTVIRRKGHFIQIRVEQAKETSPLTDPNPDPYIMFLWCAYLGFPS
jgi:hypothetical protein